jgi:hypothetical protein
LNDWAAFLILPLGVADKRLKEAYGSRLKGSRKNDEPSLPFPKPLSLEP